MSKIYPIDTVQIMSDNIFTLYGGDLGSTSSPQRQAAYYIAEESLCLHMKTLLTPNNVITGSFTLPPNGMVTLDWGYVNSLDAVIFTDFNNNQNLITDISWALRDRDFGHVNVGAVIGTHYGIYCEYGSPYNLEIVYQAGLQTGVSMRPNVYNALEILSDIALKEMSELGLNEGVGDIGIKSYSTSGYSESRYDLIRTSLGTSARANYARKLVQGLALKEALRFR